MRLRTIVLVSILALGLLAGPLPAEAHHTGKVYRIGYLSLRDGFEAREKAFRQGLRELRYIEGQNIVVEWRFAKGNRDRIRELADELVRLKVDCIVTTNTPTTRAAKKATSTIPIVMVNVGDPVGGGHCCQSCAARWEYHRVDGSFPALSGQTNGTSQGGLPASLPGGCSLGLIQARA